MEELFAYCVAGIVCLIIACIASPCMVLFSTGVVAAHANAPWTFFFCSTIVIAVLMMVWALK